jgi:hypothetical protein
LVARVPTGWQFVNYEEYQPTKAEVEKKRQKAQRRMQKARAARSRNVRANKSERAEVFTRTDQVRSERVRVTRSDPDRSHLEDQDQNLPALRAGTFQQALENPSSLSPASSPHADARVQATLSDRLEHAGDGADRRLRVGDAHQAAGGRAGVRPVSEAAPDDRRDAGGGTRAWPDAPAASPSEACGAAARVPVVAADVAGGVGVGAELHDPRDRRAALSTARTLSELTALSDTFRIGPKRTKGAA